MASQQLGTLRRSVKEAARHLLHRLGVPRRLDYLAPAARADRFGKIYADGVWVHGDPAVPTSGHGSSLAATHGLREALPALLDRLGAETLLDVGCGDWTWMQATPLRQRYIGVDVVASVIAQNRRLHSSDRRSFVLCDAVEDALPPADVVFCREVLFHLSFADAKALLRNVLASPRRTLILTSDTGTAFNSDIHSGDFRLLNLERPPFRFPRPAQLIGDDLMTHGRLMGVWPAADIAHALGVEAPQPR